MTRANYTFIKEKIEFSTISDGYPEEILPWLKKCLAKNMTANQIKQEVLNNNWGYDELTGNVCYWYVIDTEAKRIESYQTTKKFWKELWKENSKYPFTFKGQKHLLKVV